MSESNPSILSHVSLGCQDLSVSMAFYDEVLQTLGIRRVETIDGIAAAYGRAYPEFWISLPLDEQAPSVGNGTHIAFLAESAAAVDAFYSVARKRMAEDAGAPGKRPIYGDPYYGCFVLDPDGHKIEATFWDADDAS